MARKKVKPASSTGANRGGGNRASWRGNLTFGLVSFAVEAFNALDRTHSDIHFHQLHAPCHSRIYYSKVCPIHGEVTNDEIVSGYEYKKGTYVEVDPDELEALRTEAERALKIDAFITPETVDPLYFDGRMYYLLPNGASAHEPYAVFAEAMQREDRYAIGQLPFSGKDQIALVRPLDGVLHMAMLNYAAEIRDPEKLASSLKKPAGLTRELRVAQSLIEDWTEDKFDFGKYHDRHREQLQELIKAKVAGKEIVAPEEEAEQPVVVNLMDALKQSLKHKRGGAGTTAKPKSKPKTKAHARSRSA